jgi:hypothetical protein
LIEVVTSLLLAFLATLGRKKQTPKRAKKKNVCQVAMPNGLMLIWIKGIHKVC